MEEVQRGVAGVALGSGIAGVKGQKKKVVVTVNSLLTGGHPRLNWAAWVPTSAAGPMGGNQDPVCVRWTEGAGGGGGGGGGVGEGLAINSSGGGLAGS